MWLFTLIACGNDCADRLTSLNDDGSEGDYADVVEAAREARNQLDHRCYAHITLTSNAPPNGEMWRDPDGWTTTIHPYDATERRVREQVCETYALEYPKHLSTDVFGPRDASFQAFIDACADGPTVHRFPEQASTCGYLPPAPIEAFMDAEVFVGAPIPRAPDLPMTPGPVLERPQASFGIGSVANGARFSWQDHTVRIDRLDGSFTVQLPEDQFWTAFSGDTSRLALLEGFSRPDTLVMIDLVTGALDEQPLDWPDVTMPSNLRSVLVDDVLVVPNSSPFQLMEGPGVLALVPIQGAPTVEILALTPPENGMQAVPTEVWRDPTGNAVWVRVVEADITDGGGTIGGVVLAHVDLETGEQTRWYPPSGLPLDILGAHPDGVLVSIRLDEELPVGPGPRNDWDRTLFGIWNPRSGSLRVSPDLCSFGRAMVLDETVVVVEDFTDEGMEIWSTWEL